MEQIEAGRELQLKLMHRSISIVRACFAIGKHVVIETPLHSRWWEEEFCSTIRAMQDEPEANPFGLKWRQFTTDKGRKHKMAIKLKKPTRFMTTAPAEYTAYITSRYDYTAAQAPLRGQEAAIALKTRATADKDTGMAQDLPSQRAKEQSSAAPGSVQLYSSHASAAASGGCEHWSQ